MRLLGGKGFARREALIAAEARPMSKRCRKGVDPRRRHSLKAMCPKSDPVGIEPSDRNPL